MANENDVEIKFKTTAELAAAEATAGSMEKVAAAQKKVGDAAKTTAADGKALEAHMRGLADQFKASQQQYNLDAHAKKNATAQTVQFGEAQGKAAQLTDEATRALHSAKEGQAAVKDLSQGLGQILDGNLAAGFINVTKAAKGFSALDIAGRLGLIGAAVSAGITLWQAYQAVLEAVKKGEEEAAKAISEGTTTALASRVEGLKQANAEMAKSIEHSRTIRDLESQAATAASQGKLADVSLRESQGDIDAFDANRQRAQITFDEESQRIGTQMFNVGEEMKKQREIIDNSQRIVGEAEDAFVSTAGNADLHAAADQFLKDSQATLKTEQEKLKVLEEQQKVFAKQSATAKQQRDATLAEIERAEGDAFEKNMQDISRRGAEEATRQAETRRKIREDISQSDDDAMTDDAMMEDDRRESARKATEAAAKADREASEAAGFDPITGRRGRRTRPGAPNVSPPVGSTNFDEVLKPRLNQGEAAIEKAAKSADGMGDKVAESAGKVAAAVDSAAGAIEGAFGSIEQRLSTLESQANFSRTRATT